MRNLIISYPESQVENGKFILRIVVKAFFLPYPQSLARFLLPWIILKIRVMMTIVVEESEAMKTKKRVESFTILKIETGSRSITFKLWHTTTVRGCGCFDLFFSSEWRQQASRRDTKSRSNAVHTTTQWRRHDGLDEETNREKNEVELQSNALR